MDGYDGSFHTYDEEDFDLGSSGRAKRRRKARSRRRERSAAREGEGWREGEGDEDNKSGSSSRDPFSGLLAVVGRPCRLHRDDALAAEVDAGAHLVNLSEDAMGTAGGEVGGGCDFGLEDSGDAQRDDGGGCDGDEDDRCYFVDPPEEGGDEGFRKSQGRRAVTEAKVLVDRHDARSLLDPSELELLSRSAARMTVGNTGGDDEEETDEETIRQLNFERYGPLPEYRTVFLGQDERNEKLQKPLKSGEEDEKEKKPAADGEDTETTTKEVFQLNEAEMKALPMGIVTPSDRRTNDVVRMTAERASATPQFEVMLKVRQSSNAQFAFLAPGHELHPYYLFLRENGGKIPVPRVKEEGAGKGCDSNEDSSSDGKMKVGGGGALGGLLGMYSSSEDEDSNGGSKDDGDCSGAGAENREKGGVGRKESDAAQSEQTVQGASSSNSLAADDERRAKRLKRAKLMKEHFALKMKGESH